MKIELTEDQCELISKLLDLMDRGLESLTLSEMLSRDEVDWEWEKRMLTASQELAEEFPTTEYVADGGRWYVKKAE